MEDLHSHGGDGTPLFCRRFGPESAEAVVLCHCLAANGDQFLADAGHWARAGRTVLVPDLRAHGRSGRPAVARTENFAIEVMARDMLAMLDAAGVRRVHWVGNSLGGIVALQMLGMAPERFASLATFGTAYRLNLPPGVAGAFPLLHRALGAGLLARTTAAMTTRNPAGRRVVEGMLRELDAHAAAAVARNVARYDLTAEAAGFAGPILLIRGGLDRAVNRALPRTLEAMRGHQNFELHELPQGGHCANLDVPEVFRTVLERFWRRVGG